MNKQATERQSRIYVTVKWSGFHGLRKLEFCPREVGKHPLTGEPAYKVSPLVARRLNGAVCGFSGCRCGDKIAFQISDGDDGWVSTEKFQVSDRESRSN